MEDWSDWIAIASARARHGPFAFHGIYQVRCTDRSGAPLPIHRLVGVDKTGLLYIGRSGLPSRSERRTVANRLDEFMRQEHSGGKTYVFAAAVMGGDPSLEGHRLEARGRRLPESEIERLEDAELTQYLMRHGELPPCNSKMPAVKGLLYGRKPKWSA